MCGESNSPKTTLIHGRGASERQGSFSQRKVGEEPPYFTDKDTSLVHSVRFPSDGRGAPFYQATTRCL